MSSLEIHGSFQRRDMPKEALLVGYTVVNTSFIAIEARHIKHFS